MACTQKERRESGGLARRQMQATVEGLREEPREVCQDGLTAVVMRTPGCRHQGQKPAHRQVAM